MARHHRKHYQHQLVYAILMFSLVTIGAFIYFGSRTVMSSMAPVEMNIDTPLQETGNTPQQETVEEQQAFINELAPKAQEIQQTYSILPSIIIAQGILESDWGKSGLAQKENNYFGIKGGTGSPTYQTQEYTGEWETVDEPFRSYDSMEESMVDHAKLLYYGTTWNNQQYQSVLEATDYKEAAHALQASGYATDPNYAEKLIKLIETYHLNQYDG